MTIGNWSPGNYEGKYEGNISMARALARSSNSVSVQLTHEAGPATVGARGAPARHQFGFAGGAGAGAGYVGGDAAGTDRRLCSFRQRRSAVVPYAIVRVRTDSGETRYRRAGSGMGRVMNGQEAAQMVSMMHDAVTTGTGRAAALGDRPSAGKTGTSQDFRDAWFVGFTADLVCGVWIGNDNDEPMQKATGGGLPARIFHTFMTDAHRGLPARPLRATLFAVASAPAATPANAPTVVADASQPDGDKDLLDRFQHLLDKSVLARTLLPRFLY